MAGLILQGWLCMPCCYARLCQILCTPHEDNFDTRKNWARQGTGCISLDRCV